VALSKDQKDAIGNASLFAKGFTLSAEQKKVLAKFGRLSPKTFTLA